MAELTATPRVYKRSPIEIAVDRVWRFFCSVRAAVYEVAILALLVLIGTLRGSSVPNEIKTIFPFTNGVVTRWYAWDVFHSLPFMFMLALLSVAITICTMNRAPAMWKTIAHPTITTTRGFLNSAEISAAYAIPGSLEQSVVSASAAFRKRGYRVLTQNRDGETHLYADRFRYAKLGTYPFHLALIMILIGGIVGARYGFRDNQFIVPEGSVRDVGHGTGLSLGLTKFTDTYREDGTPEEYRSDLVVYNNGKPVKTGSITVNHPLNYHNVVFYQSSFGQAVSLRITDQAGHELFNDSIPLGQWTAAGNPEAPAGILELPEANAEVHVIAPDTDPASMPQLDTLHLSSGEMYVQVRPRDASSASEMPGSKVIQGQTVQLDGLNIEFVRERQFSLLQIAHNPGIPIFWMAAFLLVGGLAVVFYFPHRRVRAIFSPPKDGVATALFAPLAKRDWSGTRDFTRLIGELESAFGAQAAVRSRAPAEDDPPHDATARSAAV